jgi:hypothetical protein
MNGYKGLICRKFCNHLQKMVLLNFKTNKTA